MTACADAPNRPVLVNRAPPAELLPADGKPSPCPDEPPLPVTFANDAAQASWLDQAIENGDECRAAYRALARWVKEPPK